MNTANPGFVIFGAETGAGGVVIIASTDLEEAELHTRMGPVPDLYGPPGWSPHEYTLRTRMRRYTAAFGTDYADAFARLLGTWQPPGVAAELTMRMPRALTGRDDE